MTSPTALRLLGAAAVAAIAATPIVPVVAQAQEASIIATNTAGDDVELAEAITDGVASLAVQADVEPGGAMVLHGTGWFSADGASGSTIVVKLRYAFTDGESGNYAHVGGDVLQHPKTGVDDATMWAIIEAGDDGEFTTEIQLPDDLIPGQRLSVNAASGIDDADTSHSLTSRPVSVGGIEWVDNSETIECVPETPQTSIDVAPRASEDNTLEVSGTGWCNEFSGGAQIALKIDDGAYSRLNDELNANRTIWYIIDADDETGSFTVQVPLPDGTESGAHGSTPAFSEGVHSLRALSGSMQEGDPVRTYPLPTAPDSMNFTVGEYAPNGNPPIVAADVLNSGTANGMDAEVSATEVEVSLPAAAAGDWVYLSAVVEDGSGRWPWSGTWFQADAGGTVTAPLTGLSLPLPNGEIRLVAQSGNEENFGDVIGWTETTLTGGAAGNDDNDDDNNDDDDARGTDKDGDSDATGWAGVANDITKLTSEAEKLFDLIHGSDDRDTAAEESTIAEDEVIEVVEYVTGASAPATVTSGTGNPARVSATAAGTGNSARVSAATVSTGTTSGPKVTAASGAGGEAAEATPQPGTIPEAPVATALHLTDANRSGVTGQSEGTTLTVSIPGEVAAPGAWVFVHSYDPTPAEVGWTVLDEHGNLTIDAAGMGDGQHKFSLTGADGELLGWAAISLTGQSAQVMDDGVGGAGDVGVDKPVLLAQSALLMKASDWVLIIGAIAIVQLAMILTFLTIRRQERT